MTAVGNLSETNSPREMVARGGYFHEAMLVTANKLFASHGEALQKQLEDQQIEQRMPVGDHQDAQSRHAGPSRSDAGSDRSQASASRRPDVPSSSQGDNATETVHFIPITDWHMEDQKRDLWNIRVTENFNASSSARNDPGIHFTYDKIEAFLSKEAYNDLKGRTSSNRFGDQIKKIMNGLVPDSLPSNNPISEFFVSMRNRQKRRRVGEWSIKVVGMTLADFQLQN